MSPYDPARSGRIQDLVAMVHVGAEQLSVVREIALVDAAGNPLTDKAGQQIRKRIDDCDKIKDEIARSGCQQVFFDVKACRGKPDEPVCTHKAIARWVVKHLNAGDDQAAQIIVVGQVPLVSSDGTPIKDKAGAPIVKQLADCATATDVDSCRELFLNVSACKINPPDDGNLDGCIKDAVSTWIDANQSELDAH
jgi:uracil-DNA glycosylase